MYQPEGIDYYYELPYTLLPREYRRIPYNCREAIPRSYDKRMAEELSNKYKVLRITQIFPTNEEKNASIKD